MAYLSTDPLAGGSFSMNPGQAVDPGSLIDHAPLWPTASTGGNTGINGGNPQTLAPSTFGNLSDPAQWMALVQDPAKLKQWLTTSNPQLAQLFQQNPSLADYYVQQIQKSPGANATEQAGSAQYWTNKVLQDPGITGKPGGFGAGGISNDPFGQYSQGYHLPTEQEALNMPGLQFAIDQAGRAVQSSAAAKGTLLTGGTLKALSGYTTGTALQGYSNLANLGLGAYNTNYNVWRNNQNDTTNALYNMAQLGKPGA